MNSRIRGDQLKVEFIQVTNHGFSAGLIVF
jgi:hypothetical protein